MERSRLHDCHATGRADTSGLAGAIGLGSGAQLLMRSSMIRNCSAAQGGAIGAIDALIVLVGSNISSCSAVRSGGAMSVQASSLRMTAASGIADCVSSGSSQSSGGALHVFLAAEVSLTDATLTSNSATNSGGAVALESSALTLERCDVRLCRANGAGGGGAIHITSGSLLVQRSSFSDNGSPSGEGGVIGIAGIATADIVSSVLDNNHAYKGGGIATALGGQPRLVVVGTVVRGCTAVESGRALCIAAGTVEIDGSYIERCSGNSRGAVFCEGV
eukprot:6358792-Prymnesium_polylepis.1